MSLDKSIQHGKEHRKPYRKAKAVDRTCRNHGTCGYCEGNRTISNKRRLMTALEIQKDTALDFDGDDDLYANPIWK